MKRWNVFPAGFLALAVLLSSCSKDEEPGEYLISQDQLDSSTNLIATTTGGNMAHAGSLVSDADSTIREIFSNEISLDGGLSTGVIVTKNAYKKNTDGSKGDLLLSFVMIKREAGYDDENENWEYIVNPFDASVDYNAHPFGMLQDESNTDMRGQLASCIACHAGGGGGDYLFVND